MDESKEELCKLGLPVPPDEYYKKNADIAKILDDLQTSVYLDETLGNLKRLAQKMSEESKLITILLYHYYINIDSRHSMRTTILRILNTITKDEQKKIIMREALAEYFDKYIMTYYKQIVKPIQIQQLNSLFTNIPFGLDILRDNGKDILVATHICFEELMEAYLEDRSHKLHMSLYNVVKLLVSIVQKGLVEDSFRCTPSEHLGYIYELIIDNSLNFDIRCNAGILFVFYSTHNIRKSTKSLSDYPFLFLMGINATPVDMLDVLQQAVNGNIVGCIAMYGGLIVWSKEVHLNTIVDTSNGAVSFAEYIFGTLVDFCERKGDCWVPATRIMLALCRANFIMRVKLFKKIMRFCEQHMDHSVDTVRHSMKNLYKAVLTLAAKESDVDLKRRYLDVVNSLVMDIKNGQMYHYIIPIAEEFGCQYILTQIPDLQNNLIHLMRDETVSQQLYMTYRSLMTLHHKLIAGTEMYQADLPMWRSHWILALAQAIRCEVTTIGINASDVESVFVPQYLTLFIDAFRLDRQIIYLLGPVDMRCESQLEAVLKCLHQCYKEGIQTDAYTREYSADYRLWRDLVPCYVMERVRAHRSAAVRIAALSLVVDTSKTCAPFNDWESCYLRRFYAMHARESNAAARHQMLALLERAIKRANDSREVALKKINMIDWRRDARRAAGDQQIELAKDDEEYEELTAQENIALRFINSFYRMAVMYATNAGACHNRRTIALHLISYLQKTYLVGCIGSSGGYGASDDDRVYNASITLAQGAQRLVMEDGYESVVQQAYMIMVRLGTGITRSSVIRTDHHSTLMNIIQLACSIRPSDAISAAYQLCELLRYDDVASVIPSLYPALGIEPDNHRPKSFQSMAAIISLLVQIVEARVEAALTAGGKKTLDDGANRNGAFYGLLGCVRVLLKEYDLGNTLSHNVWKYLITVFVPLLCHRIPTLVSPIIGDSAPEGFLPYDTTHAMDDIADISNDSQMIVVYAWRSVKEVSLLLGEICERCPDMTEMQDDLHAIGTYFVNLFLNAKHRGAYEQASVGFQQVCKRLWNLLIEEVPWPVTELVKIKFIVDNQDEEGVKKLCPTRRSAGIPFMVQTILATEPKELLNKHFNDTIEQLLHSCETANALEVTKLHGMNILRALVRHNELGEKVIPYVGDAVILALRAFDHQSWAVRNSATLLFAALMTRMFGVQRSREHISKRNQMTYCAFFSRHTKLAEFLLGKMRKLCKDANASMCHSSNENTSLNYVNITNDLVIQPILMILCRLYNCNDDEHIDVILTFLQLSASNSNFKTRELACEVTTTILPDAKQKDYLDNILAVLLQVRGPCNGNYLHGLILQMSYLFNAKVGAICEKLLDMDEYIKATMWIVVGAGTHVDYCSATEYLELCHHFVTIAKGYRNTEILMKILLYQNLFESDSPNNRITMKVKYCTTRLSLIIYIILNLPMLSKNKAQNLDTDSLRIESIAQTLAQAISPTHCAADTALFILTFFNAPFARSACAAALYSTGELIVPNNIKRLCQAVTAKTSASGYLELLQAFVRAVNINHIRHWMDMDGELYTATCFFMLNTPTYLREQAISTHIKSFVYSSFTNDECKGGAGIVYAFCMALETYAEQAIASKISAPNAVTHLAIYLPEVIDDENVPTCVKVSVFNVCIRLVEYAKLKGLDIRGRQFQFDVTDDKQFKEVGEFVLIWNVIINLLEDEDEEVRNHTTMIYKNLELTQQSYPNTPECTIEVIYQHWARTLPTEMALVFVMYRILFSDADRAEFIHSIGQSLKEKLSEPYRTLRFGTDTSTTCATNGITMLAAQMAAATINSVKGKKKFEYSSKDSACINGDIEDDEKVPRIKVFAENQESFHYHESDFNDAEAFKYFKDLIFDIPNFNFDKNQIFVVERLQLATNKLRTYINALKLYMPVQLFQDLVDILVRISEYLDEASVEDYDNNVAWQHFHNLIVKQCSGNLEIAETRMYNLLYHIYCFEPEAWQMHNTNPLGL